MKHEFKGNLTFHSHDQRASGTVPIFINILYASALFPMSVSQSSLEPLLHISINAFPRTTPALPCECVRESVWRGSSSFYPETSLSVAADCAQLHGPWSKRPPGRGRGVERGEERGPGGGHSATKWLPTAKRPCGVEAVNAKIITGGSTPLKAKNGGQLQTKHLIRVVACKMCLFLLYFVKYMMFIALHALWNDWIDNSALRKFDFRGRWSVSPKNRGRSKKTQGWTGLKSGGSSLAVSTYLQRKRQCPPPPPPGREGCRVGACTCKAAHTETQAEPSFDLTL